MLIGGRHELAAAPERRAGHTETAGARQLGQVAQVGVAPGGLHQDRPRVHRRRHHDLGARSAGEPEGEPALVLSGELVHPGHLVQAPEQLGRRDARRPARYHVAHDLAPAADVTRDDRGDDPGQPLQRPPQAFGLLGRVMRQPVGAGLAQVGDALEDVLRRLLAETRKLGQAPIPGGRLQLRQRVDAEDVVDLANLGHAQSGDGEHLDQSRRDLLPQLFQQARPAGARELRDDLERGRTDALGGGQGAVFQ